MNNRPPTNRQKLKKRRLDVLRTMLRMKFESTVTPKPGHCVARFYSPKGFLLNTDTACLCRKCTQYHAFQAFGFDMWKIELPAKKPRKGKTS